MEERRRQTEVKEPFFGLVLLQVEAKDATWYRYSAIVRRDKGRITIVGESLMEPTAAELEHLPRTGEYH